jgi:hypothetical protein
VTVIVGFLGAGGAVMASDSQASEQDNTRYDAPKIWEDNGVLFGYSGNTAVLDPIQLALHQRFEGEDTSQSRWNMKVHLCEAIRPVLRGEYVNYVPAPPPGQVPAKLAGSLLVIGRDADGYWLADVDHNCLLTFHMQRGFHALGSGSHGAGVARGLLEHYDPNDRTIAELRLLAYRTVETCIRVSAMLGVGGSVQLWESTDGEPAFQRVTGEALDSVEYGVAAWMVIERESLKEAAGEEPENVPDVEQPAPLEEPEKSE